MNFSLPSFRMRRSCAVCVAVFLTGSLAARDWGVEDLKTTAIGHPLGGSGRRPGSLLSREYVRLLADDTRDTLAAPLHWDRHDWLLAGGLGALVAGSSAFDRQIREESQENRTHLLDTTTRQLQRFGAEYSFLVLGGFEVYGRLAQDGNARATAMDGITSSIIAAGIITPVLKYGVGRSRPREAANTFAFRPFSGSESFPSGHTTQAFAVASVIVAHYPNWPTRIVAYGIAGMVGYSRIEQNAHFASDVVAGAIIGTAVGLHVVKLHDRPRETPGKVSLSPFTSGRVTGLMFHRDF